MTDSALDFALQAATRGWRVFPIQPGTKYPYAGFKWRELSTNDPDKIRIAASHPRYKGCNWAIDCGGSDLTVLDVDVKNGKNGLKTLEESGYPLPDTFTVETPTGGRHLYFSGTAGTVSASMLGPGLDHRSTGGYVLAPGSINGNGRPYAILNDTRPAPVPPWFYEKLNVPTEPQPAPQRQEIPLVDLDLPHNITLAIEYLKSAAPQATEGAGGDQTTYQVACALRDRGISQDTALQLLLEYWNDTKAHPPWSIDDLQRKVKNAYQYARDEPGNKSAEATFPNPLLEGKAIRCAGACRVEDLKPRKWLLGYRYLRDYVTVTIAPGGVGKSLLTIAEGLSVASGKPFIGQHIWEPAPCGVWLYNTEDPFDELERRILAAAQHHGVSRDSLSRFWYSSGYEHPLKIAMKDERGRAVVCENVVCSLIGAIRERGVGLLIVDPFVECHGVDENSNTEVGLVVQAFRRIAKETGCAVSLVHHTSKGKAEIGEMDKARGASALVYAARIAHTLYVMSEKEAREYGVVGGRRKWYVRLDDAKANLSPPGIVGVRGLGGSGSGSWFQKVSVPLGAPGGGAELETTGVLEPVALTPVSSASVEVEFDRVIADCVMQRLGEGDSDSTYGLATSVASMSVLELSEWQIRRRIEELFKEAVVTPDGLHYIAIKRKGMRGRYTTYICCNRGGEVKRD